MVAEILERDVVMKLKVTVNGQDYEIEVEVLDDVRQAAQPGAAMTPMAPQMPPPPAPAGPGAKVLSSPIPGTVVEVQVKVGQQVKRNDPIMIIDAMKMNTQISAVADGVVKELLAKSGDAVKMGQTLVTFE